MNSKRCYMCKDVKLISKFNRDSYSADGRRATCADCRNARRREQYRVLKEIDKNFLELWDLNDKLEKLNKQLEQNHLTYYKLIDEADMLGIERIR